MRITFDQAGDFQACFAAEDWCRHHGISVSAAERGKPRNLYVLAKARADLCRLDGIMTGDMLSGPVSIVLAPSAARDVMGQGGNT